MGVIKINQQNSLINRLAFGNTVEPSSSENHIDIYERGIGFNAYYNEINGKWISCHPNTNYIIQFLPSEYKKLSIGWSNNNPVGTEVNFSDRILFDYDGSVQISGNRKTVVNYSSNGTLSILQSGFVITNRTAPAQITLTLPQAFSSVIGIYYYFHVIDAAALLIVSHVGDAIWDRSNSGTELRSTWIASTIKLVCIEPGKWEVEDKHGTWTLI